MIFNEITVEIATNLGAPHKFKEKRNRIVNRFFDGILQYYCFNSAEEYFKINVF